jgi:hypothetical protein
MGRRTGVLLVVDYVAVATLAVGFTLWLTPPDSPRRWGVWVGLVLVPILVAGVRRRIGRPSLHH